MNKTSELANSTQLMHHKQAAQACPIFLFIFWQLYYCGVMELERLCMLKSWFCHLSLKRLTKKTNPGGNSGANANTQGIKILILLSEVWLLVLQSLRNIRESQTWTYGCLYIVEGRGEAVINKH